MFSDLQWYDDHIYNIRVRGNGIFFQFSSQTVYHKKKTLLNQSFVTYQIATDRVLFQRRCVNIMVRLVYEKLIALGFIEIPQHEQTKCEKCGSSSAIYFA